MNLFLNAIQENGVIILFDSSRKIIFRKDIKVLWNESSKLINILNDFLNESNIDYKSLENIVVANWPWSFTGIRTIVLLINTINYVIKKHITTISYFDMFKKYPIVKPSSRRDYFLQKNKDSQIDIISNDNLKTYFIENNIDKVYWDINIELYPNIQKFDIIDYSYIIKNIKLDTKKIIRPLYIKKPSIS